MQRNLAHTDQQARDAARLSETSFGTGRGSAQLCPVALLGRVGGFVASLNATPFGVSDAGLGGGNGGGGGINLVPKRQLWWDNGNQEAKETHGTPLVQSRPAH
jgi:hypothetical protein